MAYHPFKVDMCFLCAGPKNSSGYWGTTQIADTFGDNQIVPAGLAGVIDSAGCAEEPALCKSGLGERNGEVNQGFSYGSRVGCTPLLNGR